MHSWGSSIKIDAIQLILTMISLFKQSSSLNSLSLALLGRSTLFMIVQLDISSN
jgi:hypothetical protein